MAAILKIFTIFSIIQLGLSVSLTKSGTREALFPDIPNDLLVQGDQYHALNEFVDLTITYRDQTISGVASLQDQLSYNCLSQNYELTLIFPDPSSITTVEYALEGTIMVPFFLDMTVNITGRVGLNCSSLENNRCPFMGVGQIGAGALESYNYNFLLSDLVVIFSGTADNGTVDGAPITEDDKFTVGYLGASMAQIAFATRGAARLETYLNLAFLPNMSRLEFEQMTGGDCADRPKLAPELPVKFEFDPITSFINESYHNSSLEFRRTVHGLDDMQDELSYNCLSKRFEWSILIKNLSLESTFFLEGSHALWDPTVYNATGILIEKCPMESVNGCVVGMTGLIEENGGKLSSRFFALDLTFEHEFQVVSGFLNGSSDWDSDTHQIISSTLLDFRFEVGYSFALTLQTLFDELLAGMTLTELIERSGGDCQV